MTINGVELATGQTVSFESEVTTDHNVYTGVVVGVSLTYAVAKAYGDLAAYHDGLVMDEKPDIDDDEVEFFIIRLSSNDQLMAFASIWVEDGTFTLIDVGNNVLFTVYNLAAADIATVVQLLQDNGYNAKQTATTT